MAALPANSAWLAALMKPRIVLLLLLPAERTVLFTVLGGALAIGSANV